MLHDVGREAFKAATSALCWWPGIGRLMVESE